MRLAQRSYSRMSLEDKDAVKRYSPNPTENSSNEEEKSWHLTFYIPSKEGGMLAGRQFQKLNRTMTQTNTQIKLMTPLGTETPVKITGRRSDVANAKMILMNQLLGSREMLRIAEKNNMPPTEATMAKLTRAAGEPICDDTPLVQPRLMRRDSTESLPVHMNNFGGHRRYPFEFQVKIGSLLSSGVPGEFPEVGRSISVEGVINYDTVQAELSRTSGLPLDYTLWLQTPTGWRQMRSQNDDLRIWKKCLIEPPVHQKVLYLCRSSTGNSAGSSGVGTSGSSGTGGKTGKKGIELDEDREDRNAKQHALEMERLQRKIYDLETTNKKLADDLQSEKTNNKFYQREKRDAAEKNENMARKLFQLEEEIELSKKEQKKWTDWKNDMQCVACFELRAEMIFCAQCTRVRQCTDCFAKDKSKVKRCPVCKIEWSPDLNGAAGIKTNMFENIC